jgi:hypothetical protein
VLDNPMYGSFVVSGSPELAGAAIEVITRSSAP